MPYIKSNDGRREALAKGDVALTAGELNYQIFYYVKHGIWGKFDEEIVKGFVANFLGESPNYQKYNDMTGVLIRCGFEIERRLKMSPEALNIATDFLMNLMLSYNKEIEIYEDLKIKENSDVE